MAPVRAIAGAACQGSRWGTRWGSAARRGAGAGSCHALAASVHGRAWPKHYACMFNNKVKTCQAVSHGAAHVRDPAG